MLLFVPFIAACCVQNTVGVALSSSQSDLLSTAEILLECRVPIHANSTAQDVDNVVTAWAKYKECISTSSIESLLSACCEKNRREAAIRDLFGEAREGYDVVNVGTGGGGNNQWIAILDSWLGLGNRPILAATGERAASNGLLDAIRDAGYVLIADVGDSRGAADGSPSVCEEYPKIPDCPCKDHDSCQNANLPAAPLIEPLTPLEAIGVQLHAMLHATVLIDLRAGTEDGLSAFIATARATLGEHKPPWRISDKVLVPGPEAALRCAATSGNQMFEEGQHDSLSLEPSHSMGIAVSSGKLADVAPRECCSVSIFTGAGLTGSKLTVTGEGGFVPAERNVPEIHSMLVARGPAQCLSVEALTAAVTKATATIPSFDPKQQRWPPKSAMSHIASAVDQIYVLCLDCASVSWLSDSWRERTTLLDVKRFDGETNPTDWHVYKVATSHRAVAAHAQVKGYKTVLVIESDVEPTEAGKTEFSSAMSTSFDALLNDNKWEVIRLTHRYHPAAVEPACRAPCRCWPALRKKGDVLPTSGLCRVRMACYLASTAAYLMSSRAFGRFITGSPFGTIDKEAINSFAQTVVYPMLAVQPGWKVNASHAAERVFARECL